MKMATAGAASRGGACPHLLTKKVNGGLRSRKCLPPIAAVQSTSFPKVGPVAEHNPVLIKAVEALFSFPPLWDAARKGARQKIIDRADVIGVDWEGTLKAAEGIDWDTRAEECTDSTITYPEYYEKPFHAYVEGNLCWEAALEVEMAAKCVHANMMDPDNVRMDAAGDWALRTSYHARMKQLLGEMGVPEPRDVVDLGCATGLSSLALLEAFPEASVTGIDLSPNFLAVGLKAMEARNAATGKTEKLTLRHGLAEATGLPDSSVDMVSMCLVMHELPGAASCAVIREAERILRPGGTFCVMEMDPLAPAFSRVFSNPFAYAAFKSTEPWLEEYISLDVHAAMRERGFGDVRQLSSSPRHRTIVAVKPAA